MEEELKSIAGAEIELISSSGGVFEITVDGRIVFSKAKMRRFPDEGEIIRLLGHGE